MAGISCARAAVAYSMLFGLFAGRALALDPKQPVDRYLLATFTADDGLPSDIVNALLQTRDGFLWVGTSNGIARFDGRHFTTLQLFHKTRVIGLTRTMAQGPDGSLWAGTNSGALRIPAESLDQTGLLAPTVYHAGPGLGDEINVLYFTRKGVLWAGTNQGLYRLDHGAFSEVIPKVSVSRIEEASNGNLLVVTGQGFIEWDGAQVVPHPDLAARLAVPTDKIYNVFEDHTGARWFCTSAGVAREFNGVMEHFQPYGDKGDRESYRAVEDPQGNIWVSVHSGLARAGAGVLEPVPDTGARYIWPDRGGDVWLGTNGHGVIRLKDRIARTFTTADGLPTDTTISVLKTSDGTLWAGGICGLSSYDGASFRVYPDGKDGLTSACVLSLAEDRNHDLWVGTSNAGIFRLHDGRFTQFSTSEGLVNAHARSMAVARDGSVWVATFGGASHLLDGHFHNYTTADGLPSDRVTTVYEDRHGVIWVSTNGGIARLEGERFIGLPAVPEATEYIVLGEDAQGVLYGNAIPQATVRIEKNRLVSLTPTPTLYGMVKTPRDLWFCADVLMRTPLDGLERWEKDSGFPPDYTVFGREDGFKSTQCGAGVPSVETTNDGKVWLATLQGLAMIDAAHLPHLDRKPAIYMEKIMIGRKTQTPGHELVLPPGPHHVELHFGAIELMSPEKIHFQYRMDDVDREWIDADATNSAIYPSFPIGAHQFHVRACNRDGVWDRAGIVYNVIQQPYFYETRLFRLAVLATFGLLLILIYKLRLRHMAAQMNARLDDRVAERTRLARELHDTLLQTLHGSKIMADDALENSADPARMLRALEKLSVWLGQATHEGRAALRSLRESTTQRNDLAEGLRRAGEECNQKGLKFAFTVEGQTRDMHPIVRDEVYRIGYEAIRNACAHSQGSHLIVELSYARDLVLRVSDDGLGIDEKVVAEGKEGHFGLRGMQERAEAIGARLNFHRQRPGTQVELIVPGSLTYRNQEAQTRWAKLLRFLRLRV